MTNKPTNKPTIKERIARFLFGGIIDRAVNAAVTVRVDDSRGWDSLTAGPSDRPWAERYDDLTDSLEAWRKNFLVRHIVTLTHSYVVGNGITITSKDKDVDKFIQAFWNHPENHMDDRLDPMCDELTRSGELFPVLFTNKVDGMSYVRFVPAVKIHEIETKSNDYEAELRYQQLTDHEPKYWIAKRHSRAFRPRQTGYQSPLMLHYAVNRPIGATRGEGDLGPILPWVKRYSEWLKDRVRLNRQRTRQGILAIQVADDTQVETKRQKLRTSNPIEHGIYVYGSGEKVEMHSLKIEADDAEKDGRALRLAVATGANVGLHYLGEGESINYATAKEMGEPTARFYTNRQLTLCRFLKDLVTIAYMRKLSHSRVSPISILNPPDLQLVVSVAEVARADNTGLAKAARDIVLALREMKNQGWIDDATAVKMAFKFAGEPLGEEEINRILKQGANE